jgi:adenylate kinase family enzyme
VPPNEPPFAGRRIIVTGNSSSGKTTLAERLARSLGLSFIELDALFWLPGWQETEDEAFRAKVREALAEAPEGWVIAGNYRSRTRDITWPVADTVIWLDLPLRVTLTGILRRSWRRSRSKELLWGTNYERFWPQLKLWSEKDSLIRWTLGHHNAGREFNEARMAEDIGGPRRWYRLRSAREVEAFLRLVGASPPDGGGES